MTALLTVEQPAPLQVLQRRTTSPGLGAGRVVVTGSGAPHGVDGAEVRTVALSECFGDGTGWAPATLSVDGDLFRAEVDVGAGGWFRVEIRLLRGGEVAATGAVEPVGVGEVFVVAGQSYAAVGHEETTTITDPLGRVTATCPEVDGWRIAHDPQPRIVDRVDADTTRELLEMLAGLDLGFPHGPHSPFQGSIWPSAGNALVTALGVPVGFVHTAVGGTRVEHWAPGTQLCANVCDAVRIASGHAAGTAGAPRAVLWQQGESDAFSDTPTEVYAERLRALRTAVCTETGLDLTWLPAKSTYHPTNLRPFEAGAAIRAAVDRLWSEPGFLPGPDTDTLSEMGVHRAEFSRGGHFTGAGQRAAGAMWADAIQRLIAARS